MLDFLHGPVLKADGSVIPGLYATGVLGPQA